jgi:hypothetical protein
MEKFAKPHDNPVAMIGSAEKFVDAHSVPTGSDGLKAALSYDLGQTVLSRTSARPPRRSRRVGGHQRRRDVGYGWFTAGCFEVLNAERRATMLSPGDPSGCRVDWDRQESIRWRRFALLPRIREIEPVPNQLDRLDRSGNRLSSVLGEVVQPLCAACTCRDSPRTIEQISRLPRRCNRLGRWSIPVLAWPII